VPALHVLAVEDNSMLLETLIAYLTRDGHTVEIAINGQEGLDKFHLGHFDLAITDRAMPELNGNQLAAAIKQIAPNTPVVMLTGFGNLMQDAGDCPLGVDVVLSRPVTLEAFRQMLTKVILDSPG